MMAADPLPRYMSTNFLLMKKHHRDISSCSLDYSSADHFRVTTRVKTAWPQNCHELDQTCN